MRKLLLVIVALCLSALVVSAKDLSIYFIDVEGGQATLIVSPSGHAMLVDTGWPDANGRDADRIFATAKQAGADRIDDILITHFHADHVGGVPQLVGRMPAGTFIDHGTATVEHTANAESVFAAYQQVMAGHRHIIARPGMRIRLKGVNIKVLAADGRLIKKPIQGAGEVNPYCSDTKSQADDPSENAHSVGILLTYGKFRFVDLGDLTWNKELAMMCPQNRVGTVDVFLASHHGGMTSNSPALVWALHPRVIIMNNGAQKGGDPEAWNHLRHSPGLEDLWQLHYSVAGGTDHNVPDTYIANPEQDQADQGYAIKLDVEKDGSFSVTNTRNGFHKTYQAPR